MSCRWRGSLYKLLWREFVIFTMSYFALSFAYRFGMDEKRKRSACFTLNTYIHACTRVIAMIDIVLHNYVVCTMRLWSGTI